MRHVCDRTYREREEVAGCDDSGAMQAEERRAERLGRGLVALNKADDNGDLVARQPSAASEEDIPNGQEGGAQGKCRRPIR